MTKLLSARLPELLENHVVIGFGVQTQGSLTAKSITLNDFSLKVSFNSKPAEGDFVLLSVKFADFDPILTKSFIFADGEWVEL